MIRGKENKEEEETKDKVVRGYSRYNTLFFIMNGLFIHNNNEISTHRHWSIHSLYVAFID